MQLRYGSKFSIPSEVLQEISSHKHELCNIEQIRILSRTKTIISVGDATTKALEEAGIELKLSVVDLKTKREESNEYRHREGSVIVENDASTLSHDLFLEIEKIINSDHNGRIEVKGEEDLAVIPIIYYSDFNTVVSYGVPDVGIACISVDSNVKENIKSLIGRMSVTNG